MSDNNSIKSFGSSVSVGKKEKDAFMKLIRSPLRNASNAMNIVQDSEREAHEKYEVKKFHDMAEGIRNNTISNADMLSMSLQKSARKNKLFLDTGAVENIAVKPPGNDTFSFSKNLFGSDADDVIVLESQPRVRSNSIGDVLHHAIERSAKKKGLTVEDLLHIKASEPNDNLPYVDTNDIQDIDDSSHINDEDIIDKRDESVDVATVDEVVVDTPSKRERHKQLKHQMKTQILSTVEHQLLGILNEGSYDELTKLKGIGKVRAERIIELRGFKEIVLDDLEAIGMKPMIVKKLFDTNISNIINLLDENDEE